MQNKRIDTTIVSSLAEYFEAINKIRSHITSDPVHPPVLWFRGLSDIIHALIPSLYRTNTRTEQHGDHDYSKLHYAEDIRAQHYTAKNYHFFQNAPTSRVEWLEVMQHHGAKTRVLDWSESSIHSLLFAVEAFLDQQKFRQQNRNESVPCVWVLEPQTLNIKIFEQIKIWAEKNAPEIQLLLEEINFTDSETQRAMDNIRRFGAAKTYAECSDTTHIDYILNLSAINDEILRDRMRIKNLLLSGDILNPYYYIISRIYSDGHILKDRTMPPLAVVQPYHSERIKAQHGVFTVFPFYHEEWNTDKQFREIGLNPDAMENNQLALSALHKIILDNPQEITYELLQNGMNDSWLYPEMPVVSSEIEGYKIYN